MASLFQGAPQTATSYTTSATETPKWMQDAIYNQIQIAQNVSRRPYEEYTGQRVAGLSPLQQQAYAQTQANQGSGSPALQAAQSGMAALSNSNTATQLGAAQNQYLAPGMSQQNMQSGQGYYGQAGGMSATGAASPYLQQASNINGGSAANPYLQQSSNAVNQAIGQSSMGVANPYLKSASQSSVQNINDYMNPYTQNVTDQIARLGARNLSENLLPGVSDQFIKSGQFGGTRMGEFGSRALRDTQESVLNQQSQALQQGYGQALGASQADLSRQGQLASTAAGISNSDINRNLQGASQLAQIGSTAGSLAGQQQQNLSQIGSTLGSLTGQQQQNFTQLGNSQTNAGQSQQQLGLSAASATQQAQAADYARQMAALQGGANIAQQRQGMQIADNAALEAAGSSQQAQNQAQLSSEQGKFNQSIMYPQQQLDFLNSQIRGLASNVPTNTMNSGASSGATYGASPLSQLAQGLSLYKGLTS